MKHIAHKKLAVLLRIGLVIAALVCGAIFFWFLPQLGRGIALADPEYTWAFWPCLIFAWLFAVPVFWAMAALWAVFGRIGRGDAFCMENARAMATVSRLAFFDAVLVPVGVITLALLGAGSPGMTVIVMPAGRHGLHSGGRHGDGPEPSGSRCRPPSGRERPDGVRWQYDRISHGCHAGPPQNEPDGAERAGRHHHSQPVHSQDRQGRAVRLDTLNRLCAALDCQPADLMEFLPDPPEE